MKQEKKYKAKKRNRYVFIITILVIMGTVIGCGKKTEESFEGYGNYITNMDVGVAACEREKDILFEGNAGFVYTLDKKTESVSLLCKDPACGHGSDLEEDVRKCIAQQIGFNMQYFNGNYYYADGDGYFKSDGKTVTEVEHVEDTNIKGYPFIYDGKLYYEDKSDVEDEEYIRYDIVYRDVNDTKETVIPVGEHIAYFFPQKEGIFFCTDEGMMYFVNTDGSNKKKLSDTKVSMMILDGEYLYYTSLESEKEGLYRMKKDGTEVRQLCNCKGDIYITAISDEYVYYNKESEEDRGLYLMNKDGTGEKQISDKKMKVSVFENYDKVIGKYYDEPTLKDGEDMVIMNKDGSNLKKLQIPIPISVKRGW